MKEYWTNMFRNEPVYVKDGDYYFDVDEEADFFDEEDVKEWRERSFNNNWKLNGELINSFKEPIKDFFGCHKELFMDIACGPGMGLIPLVLHNYPDRKCLATDASSLVIEEWRKYIDKNLSKYHIDLAQFSTRNIPIKSNSLDIVTSLLGVGSSAKFGKDDERNVINEINRVLKSGGYFVTVEGDWQDFDTIEKVFQLWGQPVWKGMEEHSDWSKRFGECGFEVINSDYSYCRYLRPEDNELGEQAEKHGMKIGMKYTLYILQKK